MGDETHDDTTTNIGDSIFSPLPDEIVLMILRSLGTPHVPGRAALVSRHLARLAADATLWRCLYETRYGSPLHQHYGAFGKDWRWLYQARARCLFHPCRAIEGADSAARLTDHSALNADNVTVDCGHVHLTGKRFYWGDLQAGVPHGYGLCMSIASPPQQNSASVCACTLLAQTPPTTWVTHYEGEWHQGRFHGRGYANLGRDQRYEGDYVNGKQHGQGTLTWADGSLFCGRFENGSRHTPGLYVWPSGNRYDGDWDGSKRHGQGTFTWSTKGYAFCGLWRGNTLYGWGVCTWTNGQRLEALWEGYSARGDGVLVTRDGRRFIDTADEIFVVGSASIADDVDPLGDWGPRFRRLREIPTVNETDDDDETCVVKTIEATYPDHSCMLSTWRRNGAISRTVALHSSCCDNTQYDTKNDNQSKKRCMACLFVF